MATTPVFLPGKFHGQRSLADCGPWGCKGTRLSDWTTSARRLPQTQSIRSAELRLTMRLAFFGWKIADRQSSSLGPCQNGGILSWFKIEKCIEPVSVGIIVKRLWGELFELGPQTWDQYLTSGSLGAGTGVPNKGGLLKEHLSGRSY